MLASCYYCYMKRKGSALLRYIAEHLFVVIGVVLIWRGIWYVLDFIDYSVFGGNHLYTAIGGIIIGFIGLYMPDKDLKEIEKI